MSDQQPHKSSPRDVFLYLLATGTLYFSVYAVLAVLFAVINSFFPDPLNPYYSAGDAARWPLAFLIVIFPVYVWTARFLTKDLHADPAKKDLRVRRWLLYLTVFLSVILLIGDVVALIYNFLQGDLPLPFLLKIVSVLAVGAAVFWYYLYDLHREPKKFSEQARIFVWTALAAVLVVVIAGVFVTGSPFHERAVRFDNQRVNDLSSLQSQIVSYWQNKDALPASLDALRDPISGFAPPTDPATNAAYEYRVTGALAFELCATFDLSSADSGNQARPVMPGVNDNWNHGAGRACFERTIDPQIYGRKPVPVTAPPLPAPLPK